MSHVRSLGSGERPRLDRRTGPGPRVGEGHRQMLGSGVADFGRAAFITHPRFGLGPTRRREIGLLPMDDAGFVAPVYQLRHRLLVVAGLDIGAHVFGSVPERERPERPAP